MLPAFGLLAVAHSRISGVKRPGDSRPGNDVNRGQPRKYAH